MIKISSILVSAFISCLLILPAFAASTARTAEGLELQVQKASLGSFSGKKYIIIPLVLFNQTENKKIDIDHKFDLMLSDEFGNRYRPLPKPAGYREPGNTASESLSSLYPRESCVQMLFFEAPVAKATLLKLGMGLPSAGTGTVVEMDLAAPRPNDNIPSIIEVDPSEDGTVVNPGDIFPLRVKVNGNRLPVKVLIVAFGKTLEDTIPTQNNDYNIAIPLSAPVGPESISVIAHWTDPEKGTQEILSKNVIIYVNRAKQAVAL